MVVRDNRTDNTEITRTTKEFSMNLNQDFTMAVETIRFLQKRKSNDFIQAEYVAGKLGYSIGYLQKVIQTLSKHGLIESKRGRIGGMRLRKRKITLLDIWNVTCGQIDTVSPSVPALKQPLKAFSDALGKVVICR
jgi:DNA-binding IscR family transcriptional regulator